MTQRYEANTGTLEQAFGRVTLNGTAIIGAAVAEQQAARAQLPGEGEIVGGHYRLVTLLGEGNFGRVYVAERTDVPEHQVALKVVTRAVYADRDVERELVMLAAASDPHIVQLKDHGVTEQYVWFTMPVYRGETLLDRLARGVLGLREAHEIFGPISRGVQALHQAGLRHQDIKPENIFLAKFGQRLHPVILDLGVAVEKSSSFVAGTVLYGAPEQVTALGSAPDTVELSEKLDTYGLASTLLRSLVGAEYFPGQGANTPFEIAAAFTDRELSPLAAQALPDLTGEPRQLLCEALGGWLNRDPDERSTVGEMAEQLDVLLAQEREAAAAIERGIARQKTALRRFRLAAAAMVLVGAGAVAYGFSKRQTLRLAGELERVRAEGAASFDQLDTCVASHELTQRQVAECNNQRKRDREDQQRLLGEIIVAGDSTQQSLARKATNASAKLRTCEEDASTAAASHTAEKQSLTETWSNRQTAWERKKQTLVTERDEHGRARALCAQQLTELKASRTECRQDLAGCIEDRDTCMAVPPARPVAKVDDGKAAPPPKTTKAKPANPTGDEKTPPPVATQHKAQGPPPEKPKAGTSPTAAGAPAQ